MKERQFAGYLNSKSVYGQSWGNYELFRMRKMNNIDSLGKHNPLRAKWHKQGRYIFPSWAQSLWNFHGFITYSQRQEGLKYGQIRLFRWRLSAEEQAVVDENYKNLHRMIREESDEDEI